MTYLLTQLWLFLLIAGLIGSVLGWILRGGCKRYIKVMDEMEIKCYELEEEVDRLKKKGKQVKQLAHQKNRLLIEVKSMRKIKQQNQRLLNDLERMTLGAKKIRDTYEQSKSKVKKMEKMLLFLKQNNKEKDESIRQIKKEAIAADNLLLKYQAEWKKKYQLLHNKWIDKSTVEARKIEDDAKSTLAEMGAKLSEKESALTDLYERVDYLDNERNNESEQLVRFKEESKNFIEEITKNNAQYKKGIELLTADVQQLQDKNDRTQADSKVVETALEDRKLELEALTLQLEQSEVERKVLEKELKNREAVVQRDQYFPIEKVNLLNNRVFNEGNKDERKKKQEAVKLSVSVEPSEDHSIETIYGVGRAYSERLEGYGVSSTQDLLTYLHQDVVNGNDDAETNLAMVVNVTDLEIHSWAKMADLLRVKGITNEYAKSLELSGISSVEDLAKRKVSEVSKKMERSMHNERRIKNTPRVEEIGSWIKQAKKMGAFPQIASFNESTSDGVESGSVLSVDVAFSSGRHDVSQVSPKWMNVKRFMKRRR